MPRALNNPGAANIGSKVTGAAANQASRTSTGEGAYRSAKSAAAPALGSAFGSRVHPGSTAGLNAHKSVYLINNDTGYFNSKNQTARNSPRRNTAPAEVKTQAIQLKRANRMLDSRFMKSATSSMTELNKIMKRI